MTKPDEIPPWIFRIAGPCWQCGEVTSYTGVKVGTGPDGVYRDEVRLTCGCVGSVETMVEHMKPRDTSDVGRGSEFREMMREIAPRKKMKRRRK